MATEMSSPEPPETTCTDYPQYTRTSPDEAAAILARNAVPELEEAMAIMGLENPAVAATGVVNGHGMVTIALRQCDAYDLARWVRVRCTHEEADRAAEAADREAAP
ncbi:hypothetical protein NX801_03705 [Streptomyces sp. LP05-1]|uniref:DUF2007 domain-containing protein n=1 Tax=Streptomyces pyxinae TaxID=2970734 RepID=A0ABT2CBN2_9ACTN|nr:hypothetical protein [Streptomyces sp. LP05-1]MCS0634776.1 hypothetical protein [Streptomyces sp. LP05-1]